MTENQTLDKEDVAPAEIAEGGDEKTNENAEVEVKENIAEKYGDFESDVDYTTVLDDFEGPLDLLLHLINLAKINIEYVFVTKVTERFLDYIE